MKDHQVLHAMSNLPRARVTASVNAWAHSGNHASALRTVSTSQFAYGYLVGSPPSTRWSVKSGSNPRSGTCYRFDAAEQAAE